MRASNMQALTDAIKRRHPGVVIYGIGDDDHKLRTSDHNEDDTPGSKAAQSDADNNPEHRGIDVMLGPNFTKTDADRLVADLVRDPASRARLFNIIWNGGIWSSTWGWTRRDFGGDPHSDHPHIAGRASDDENGAGWPAIDAGGDDMFVQYGDSGPWVEYLQRRLANLARLAPGIDPQGIDGSFGDKTKRALAAFEKYCGVTADGSRFTPASAARLDAVWAKYWAAGQVDVAEKVWGDQLAALQTKVDNLPAGGGDGWTFPMTVTINKVE